MVTREEKIFFLVTVGGHKSASKYQKIESIYKIGLDHTVETWQEWQNTEHVQNLVFYFNVS